MLNIKSKPQGFTIVELLIVIVVIAILAAISVVAYQGIQSRTNDTVVKNDLANFAKKIQLVAAETGTYPLGGHLEANSSSSSGLVQTGPVGVSMSVSKGSYAKPTSPGAANFGYCAGPNTTTGEPGFVVTAASVSGAVFQYSTMRGTESLGVFGSPSQAQICSGITYPRSFSYGYFVNASGWQSWTQ